MPVSLKAEDLRQPALPRTEAELLAAPEAAPPAAPLSKSAKEYIFPFSYADGAGHSWSGTFTNKILNMSDRVRVDIAAARLGGGLPASSLDSVSSERNRAIAHMSVSLGPDRPSWATNLLELESEDLLFELWKEVCSHEHTYFHGSK